MEKGSLFLVGEVGERGEFNCVAVNLLCFLVTELKKFLPVLLAGMEVASKFDLTRVEQL